MLKPFDRQKKIALTRLTVWAVILVVLTGCSGYQIGNQSLYPSHIRTVYVPIIESSSFRRQFGERLTEAIVKEIELKTPYKVVSSPGADSVLSCSLVDEGKRVVAENRYDDPRQVEIRMQVQANWIDRTGTVLGECGSIEIPAAGQLVMGTSDLTAEMGQSCVTAQQEAIQMIAEQVVAMMEMPW